MERARDRPGLPATHRVGRARLEIDGEDPAVLLRLRAEIAGGAETWIPEALDAAFSPLDRPDRTIRVERLEVDLGLLPEGGLSPALLSEAVRRALKELLWAESGSLPAAAALPSERRTLAEAFRLFLERGRLPWWSPLDSLPALEAEIRKMAPAALRALALVVAPVLRRRRGALRLLLQVDSAAAAAVAAALPGARDVGIDAATWRSAAAFAGAVPSSPAVEEILRRVHAAAAPKGETRRRRAAAGTRPPFGAGAARRPEAEASAEPPGPLPGEDEPDPRIDAAIADAGLVLTAPFLPALLEARGLAADGRFGGEAARMHAVHLVASLAAGAAPRAEPDLVLPKLLCGWPLEEPVARASLLAPGDRAEAESLLRAMIGHWSALGRSSLEGLRETFLTRPGRLLEAPEAWLLAVEPRGADVLLGRLPWPLSPVALPWMRRPILVDWT